MKESNIYNQLANYLKYQYPDLIFRFDYGAGVKLTMGQAVKQKQMQSCRAYPDLFIAEPRGTYHGLFLEIKKEGTKIKRDKDAKRPLKGESHIRKAGDYFDQHIQEQGEVLERLKQKGYFATFAIGFDHAREIIYQYLKLKSI